MRVQVQVSAPKTKTVKRRRNDSKTAEAPKAAAAARKREAKEEPETYILRQNGEKEVVVLEPQETLKLEWMQQKVGGYIELIQLGDGKLLVVDEEGVLKDKAANEAATKLAGFPVVGDVIVTRDKRVA